MTEPELIADTARVEAGIMSGGLVAPLAHVGGQMCPACCAQRKGWVAPAGQARYLPPPAATNPIPSDEGE